MENVLAVSALSVALSDEVIETVSEESDDDSA
jgi:hypothetical protein